MAGPVGRLLTLAGIGLVSALTLGCAGSVDEPRVTERRVDDTAVMATPAPAAEELHRLRAAGLAGASLPPADRSPSVLFPGLFEDVARSGLYPTKDWVDAVPRDTPAAILAAYEREAPVTDGALRGFVEAHFSLPREAGGSVDLAPGRTMLEHIEALWPDLTRQGFEANPHASLISLPDEYIVPGGRFRELYYWDAYFTMTGMSAADGDAYAPLKESMVDNFAHLIGEYGFIPNANRTYYLSRSQPPFFFMMVGLLSPDAPEEAYAAHLDALIAEHAFWMRGAQGLSPGGGADLRVVSMPDGAILNRYWDFRESPREESFNDDEETAALSDRPHAQVYRDLRAGAESGWDYSSRWLDAGALSSIRTTQIVPVDLNALLFGLEQAIAAGCEAAGRPCAARYRGLAEARRAAMRRHLWNGELGAYDDYDLAAARLKGNRSAAALYPLFFGVASQAQGDATARFVRESLLAPGGLLTTTENTGQQWDAPNGWAPLHWLAVVGLSRYGHDALAHEIAERWLSTAARTFCETGKMVEKYNVVEVRPGGGGEYPNQDGFGWTNGVTAALVGRYPDLAAYGAVTPLADAAADRTATCERIVLGLR